MSSPQPQIVSEWAPGDQTVNHIELALTDAMVKGNGGQQQLCALRDTHNPEQVIYVTPGQIQSFARASITQDSQAGRLLASATGRS